jgi:hypothetical protein
MSAIGQDPAEPTTGAPEGAAPETEAPAAPDPVAMIGDFGGRLDSFAETLQQLTERIPEPAPAPAVEDPDPEIPSISFSDDDFDDDGSLTLEAQAREIQRIAERVVEDTLRPQREAEAQAARDAGFDALEERYPDLADEAAQDRLLAAAQQRAAALGAPQLAAEPDFVETVYLAEQARQRAGDEVPAGSERGVTLERGGTAPPATPSGPVSDDGDRIVARAKQSRFRLG